MSFGCEKGNNTLRTELTPLGIDVQLPIHYLTKVIHLPLSVHLRVSQIQVDLLLTQSSLESPFITPV